MRYFIVNTEETKGCYQISNDTIAVFGKQSYIPNDAIEVSFWKYTWFRFTNGL
jgi:hypothetical protein